MREILFRGKRLGDGEWVDGSLFIDEKKDKHEILVGYVNYRVGWEVDPETVGQFTGLTDMNGKKIFEGDIVRDMDMYLTHKKYADRGAETEEHAEKYRCSGAVDFVEFMTEDIGSCGCCFPEFKGSGFAAGSVFLGDRCEIIGNIHDNPELLEVTDNA